MSQNHSDPFYDPTQFILASPWRDPSDKIAMFHTFEMVAAIDPLLPLSGRAKPSAMRRLLTTFAAILLSACVTQNEGSESTTSATPVEVWVGGDDGLTIRLADAVEEALKASPRFTYVERGSVPDALRLGLPGHVTWAKVDGRVRVKYRVELERRGQKLAGAEGGCWESELQRCALAILRTTEKTRF